MYACTQSGSRYVIPRRFYCVIASGGERAAGTSVDAFTVSRRVATGKTDEGGKNKKIRQRQKLENDPISCCSRCVGAAEPLRRKIPRRSLRSRAVGIARTHAHVHARVRACVRKKKGKENPVRTALRDGTGKVRACRTRAGRVQGRRGKMEFSSRKSRRRDVNERPCSVPLASR